ncbi:MAG: hypothetical protein INH41_19135 [Myxococcaceae bacterium]|nr:hypothetical protein [Myxococcaceae bacterium]MCA3014501.1 hypothetical protein [Myxococcaceae bacterium]
MKARCTEPCSNAQQAATASTVVGSTKETSQRRLETLSSTTVTSGAAAKSAENSRSPTSLPACFRRVMAQAATPGSAYRNPASRSATRTVRRADAARLERSTSASRRGAHLTHRPPGAHPAQKNPPHRSQALGAQGTRAAAHSRP